MVASRSAILPAAERLNHDEACRLAALASSTSAQTVVVDLSHCFDASTSAFARLILLRRDMLQAGRDLWLAGLSGQPASLFEVHRLESVLPQLTDLASTTKPLASAQNRRERSLSAVG